MESRKKIYISGAISSDPNYKEKFYKKRLELQKEGYIVLDPTFIQAELSWGDFMHIDLAMLNICDCIYMLKDWKTSAGAQWELEKAMLWEIPVIYEQN